MRAPTISSFEMTQKKDNLFTFERFPFYIEVWTTGGSRPDSYEGRVFFPKPPYPGYPTWDKKNPPVFACGAVRREYEARRFPDMTCGSPWVTVDTSAEARDSVQTQLGEFLTEASKGLEFWLSVFTKDRTPYPPLRDRVPD